MSEARSNATARLRSSLLYGDEISNLPPVMPLIEGVFDLDNIAMIYGKWGAGKSLAVLDWIGALATGNNWCGRRVKQCKVLYVMGEGASGTAPRYEAWKRYHETEVGSNLIWLPQAPNLTDTDQQGILLDIVKDEQPTFTVLDTLARHLPGVEENSSPAMSMMVETLDEIRRITGGTALVVHHQGKNDDAGARGHSSLPGAMDTMIECRAQRTDSGHYYQLWVEKQKNREDGHSLGSWRLERVELDPHPVTGEPRSSVVPVSASAIHPVAERIISHLSAFPGVSKRALRALGDHGTVDRELAKLLQEGVVRAEDLGTRHSFHLVDNSPPGGRA